MPQHICTLSSGICGTRYVSTPQPLTYPPSLQMYDAPVLRRITKHAIARQIFLATMKQLFRWIQQAPGLTARKQVPPGSLAVRKARQLWVE
jgi:hypothetical protein